MHVTGMKLRYYNNLMTQLQQLNWHSFGGGRSNILQKSALNA